LNSGTAIDKKKEPFWLLFLYHVHVYVSEKQKKLKYSTGPLSKAGQKPAIVFDFLPEGHHVLLTNHQAISQWQ